MARVADVVRQRTGLVFPGARAADVEAAVRRAMSRRNVGSPDELVAMLEEDAAVRDALVAEITVGESYFQRDPAQFDLLRRRVIPELLSRRPPSRHLRIWSAGCAAGEEPYSVAMLFDELGLADKAEIVGTDISRPRLADAKRGVYSRWSLRSTPDDLQRRYFRQRGRYFELTQKIRSRVDFRYLNLAEDEFPSFSTGVWGMDIILCRNVLIYFDQATVERVARRLMATLSDDGWLVLGASDPPLANLVECGVVMTDSGVVYRRPGLEERAAPAPDVGLYQRSVPLTGSSAAPPARSTSAPPETFERPEAELDEEAEASPGDDSADRRLGLPPDIALADVRDAYRRRDFDAVCRLAETRAPHLPEADYVAWLRALANRGRLDEARDVAARAVAECGPTAELMYLDAVLLLEAGRPQDAAAAARQALYLDRELAVAHMALATARQRTRNRAGARRALQNAAALLNRLPPDASVPGADGESARRLAELVKINLRVLSDGL